MPIKFLFGLYACLIYEFIIQVALWFMMTLAFVLLFNPQQIS